MTDDALIAQKRAKLIVCAEPITVRAPDAAKLLGVSTPKIYELAAREDFHGAFKFGGCTLFSVEALKEWVQRQAKEEASL